MNADRPAATQDLIPSSALPLAYYLFAHAALFAAFAVLVVDPTLPGASFYHPRMVALVHVLTLAWMSGSILGSFYIVGPLALRVPMPVRSADWITFVAFAAGTSGMIAAFWTGRYEQVAWSATLVTAAVAWVGVRAARGLPRSPVPRGVALHMILAFVNMLVAAGLGILLGLDRTRGFLGLSPLAVTFAHAHVAAVGWGAMMVIGLAYRLIPMMLPSAMPAGPRLAVSALLLEGGLALLTSALVFEVGSAAAGAVLIAAAFISFAMVMRGAVRQRMPRPPALPSRDWSTWQAHAALLWLLVSVALGVMLAVGAGAGQRLTLMWLYGTAGLLGFLGQIVAGIQGRLVPFYAWYRAFAALGRPPARAANSLPSARFARAIFLAWSAGLPLVAVGLAVELPGAVRLGAAALAVALGIGAAYLGHMLRTASQPSTGGRRRGTCRERAEASRTV